MTGRDPLHVDDDLLGTQIGHYRIEEVIGQGAMGRIYRGVHPMIQREVAIKVLYQQDPTSLARFFNEARVVIRLQHPNVVEIFDLGTLPDGRSYLVMELLDGFPLNRYLRARKARPEVEAAGLLIPVCDALEAAHKEGVVHRDLKPENLFLARTKMGLRVKVLDFGIARLLATEEAARYTQAGSLLGTPQYMAPEQAEHPRDTDGRADVYSLGVILFELLTGQLPFQGESTIDTLLMHRDLPPPSPRSLVPALSPMIERVVLRCLEKNPATRYQRAHELAEALRACSRNEEPPLSLLDGLLPPLRAKASKEPLPPEVIESAKTQLNPVVAAVENLPTAHLPATPEAPDEAPDGETVPIPVFASPPLDQPAPGLEPPPARVRWPVVAVSGGATGVLVALVVWLLYPTPKPPPAPLPSTLAAASPSAPPSLPVSAPASAPVSMPASVPTSAPVLEPPSESRIQAELARARSLLRLKQREEAQAALEALVDSGANSAEVNYELARLLKANNQPDQACALLLQARELQPSPRLASKLNSLTKSCSF